MAKKQPAAKSADAVEVPQKYKGSQLLKLSKYNSRVARLVIKSDGLYTYEDADKLIFDYMKKKG